MYVLNDVQGEKTMLFYMNTLTDFPQNGDI